ncbi:MAG: hypothetical protein HZB26_15620 [Candidatus Hydrogenedentes bacterium]|nr:hypothetical protein [Candidatus Hydrogenedentota bacterium]
MSGQTTPQVSPSQDRLIPLSKWPEFHPYPSVPGLRWLVFNRDSNGFASVIRKVGKRILISESDFFRWIEAQNESAK